MKSAQDFLTEFVKDIIKHPMERPQLIAGWAKHMEAREDAIRLDEVSMVHTGTNDAANKRTPAAGSRDLNMYDVDYYVYLRKCDLKHLDPLPTYQAYAESQR